MAAPSRQMHNERLPGLDLLRVCAALAVVGFHWFYRGAAGDGPLETTFPELAPLAEYGYLGVNLFFLISGYVISRTAEGREVGAFFVARFARLYPGHLACMTVTFLVLWMAAEPGLAVTGSQWVANLTMFAPMFGQPFMDGVYWSIVIELIFYGWVAVAIGLRLYDRYLMQIAIGWLALSALNEFWIGSSGLRLLFVTEYGPLFVFGMMLRQWREKERKTGLLLVMAAAFLLSCHLLGVTRQWMLGHYGQAPGMPELVAANALMHFMLVAALAFGGRLRRTAMWSTLGALTYPVYLLHQNIGYVVIDASAGLAGRWGAVLLAGLTIVVLAVLVWRFVERPGSKLIKTAARTERWSPPRLPHEERAPVSRRSL